jgi:hypothetical protein
MITHICISPLKLTKAMTKKIFEIPEFKDNLIQVKQAKNDHVVIECEVEIIESNFSELKSRLKELTGGNSINLTFNNQPCQIN